MVMFFSLMNISFWKPAPQISEINNRNQHAAGLSLCVFYTVFTW